MSNTQQTDEVPLRQRISENPQPAMAWALAGVVLLAIEFGAVVGVFVDILAVLVNILPGNPGIGAVQSLEGLVESIPTLLSREVIPNQGYWNGQGWENTFLGLEPKYAWLVRSALVYVYAFLGFAWAWNGYTRFRRHYRYADWTPRDDVIDRLRGHTWGQFGFVVVFFFIVMAVFAPALGPTTVEANIIDPYSNSLQYWDGEVGTANGEVAEATVGTANLQSGSQGTASENYGPWTYDDYNRFHPFGTTTNGKDLFTNMATGARISLSIGLVSMGAAGLIALTLAMVTSYYKGLTDLFVILTSDSIQALPILMVLILVMVVFQGTWFAELYDGAVLMIGIFILTQWPFLWRAIRGPALQTAEQEWIDAAKSYGQKPFVIMEKHMAPYVIGYMLVYTSMSLGGIIIAVAGLSYLGLGINPPTPEWGRIISDGQPYVASASWHISLIPGVLITLVVTGFNALGDGIRDAIDPQSGTGEGENTEAMAGGSGA
ncbi:peptide/nickel transport system permease protein [Halogranum amylolyticum]|uniref:Peptide/nickel transport system permease protein n=1 Tax=Halogranum amylolyticum TaxID=660520 RepID=A0A1H8R061_9EURY|nr:ABC transporter permease [Halogranum amylolyticum]SEO59504.1 peptide/nickel transport system permease protein [Halogranum amylolyticum]